MAGEKLMDFELLAGTHTTTGSPGFRDKEKSKTYVKVVNGPAVYLKDHRDLVELFPNKFRRVYPEQIAQLAAKLNPDKPAEQEEEVAEEAPTAAKEPVPGIAKGDDVTAKFPAATANDMKVYLLPNQTYTVVDGDDGATLVEGLKGVIKVRQWLKDHIEDEGGG